jgi:hypothetical protein
LHNVVKKAFIGLKTRKHHNIIRSWILLICFIAGQYMVYVHQHFINKTANSCRIVKTIPKATVKEKCSFCDSMHHNAMVKAEGACLNAVLAFGHIYKCFEYSFNSISLILSCGRAPPFAWLAL